MKTKKKKRNEFLIYIFKNEKKVVISFFLFFLSILAFTLGEIFSGIKWRSGPYIVDVSTFCFSFFAFLFGFYLSSFSIRKDEILKSINYDFKIILGILENWDALKESIKNHLENILFDEKHIHFFITYNELIKNINKIVSLTNNNFTFVKKTKLSVYLDNFYENFTFIAEDFDKIDVLYNMIFNNREESSTLFEVANLIDCYFLLKSNKNEWEKRILRSLLNIDKKIKDKIISKYNINDFENEIILYFENKITLFFDFFYEERKFWNFEKKIEESYDNLISKRNNFIKIKDTCHFNHSHNKKHLCYKAINDFIK